MTVRNTVAGGLGVPYRKRTSVPQGCPFSMMFTALLMRPWLLMMREMSVVPRVLADDILLVTTGADHEQRFIEGYSATHLYLADMGAKLAADRSLVMSTSV